MFTEPTFPLKCNIWHLAVNEASVWPHNRPPDEANVPCQLALAPVGFAPVFFLGYTSFPLVPIIIRFPSGTPVNDGLLNTSASARGFGDHVEVPPGSGIVYGVISKFTVGRGYPNEHVRCLAYRIRAAQGGE